VVMIKPAPPLVVLQVRIVGAERRLRQVVVKPPNNPP